MIKFGINYCDCSDVMATCVANSIAEQMNCDGFIVHSTEKRCCHRNADLNNHCDNWRQSQAYREIGVVRAEDYDSRVNEQMEEIEETLNIDDFIELDEPDLNHDPAVVAASCFLCVEHANCPWMASVGTGESIFVYEAQADVCPDYDEVPDAC